MGDVSQCSFDKGAPESPGEVLLLLLKYAQCSDTLVPSAFSPSLTFML